MKTVPVYVLHIPGRGTYSELGARVFGKQPGQKVEDTIKVGSASEVSKAAESLGRLADGTLASDYIQFHTVTLNEVD